MQNKSAWSTISVIFIAILNICQVADADHDGSDDPLAWLRDSIPGEPGLDYPIFSEVESTAFSCKDRVFGGKCITICLVNVVVLLKLISYI
jgi:hypothetical protein